MCSKDTASSRKSCGLNNIPCNGCTRKLRREDSVNTSDVGDFDRVSCDGGTRKLACVDAANTGDDGCLNRGTGNRLATNSSGNTDTRCKET